MRIPRGYVVYVVYTLIWTQRMYLHGASDTEQHTLFMFRSKHAHASWYSPKWRLGDVEFWTWMWRDELLNKVIIVFFFAHKKYSRSFVKLWLNHWCHMDYFNDVLATFLDLDCGSILAESYWNLSKIYLKISRRWTKVLRDWNDMRVIK